MLLIRCAACKKKLYKYDKIGQGEVLRCHRDRITKLFSVDLGTKEMNCSCGRKIGINKGTFYKMIAKAFIYSGTKRN